MCALLSNLVSAVYGGKRSDFVSAEKFMLQEFIEKEWDEEEAPVSQLKQQSIEEMKQILYEIARYAKKSKKITPKRKRKK